MKNIFKYIGVAALGLSLASCDAIFDNLEGDLSKLTADQLFSTQAGIERVLSPLYNLIPMNAFNTWDRTTDNAAENNSPNSIGINRASFSDYTGLRDINLFFKQLEEAKAKGIITESAYNTYIGEAHFIRAYVYYAMVQSVGGAPIITEPLDDKFEGVEAENKGLYVPRATEKETWDFVLSELDKAAAALPTVNAGGTYRATKGAALALKSRVALHAASVSKYWKRAEIANTYLAVQQKLTYMEESYAANYYQQTMKAAQDLIDLGIYGLYGANPASVEAAANNLTNLFLARQSEEFIFGRSYNNGSGTNSNGFDLPNAPWQVHGSSTSIWSFAKTAVSAELADAFNNYDANGNAVDGTIITRTDGKDGDKSAYATGVLNSQFDEAVLKAIPYQTYEKVSDPYTNKDARFKAWIITSDDEFRGKTIKIQGGLWKTDGHFQFATEGSDVLNGTTYYTLGGETHNDVSGFYAYQDQNAGSHNSTGFTLRKFLNPNEIVIYSQNPWYDLRYAEVLLNYAEAAAETGTNLAQAKTYLNAIRHRAAFKDEVEPTLENVLHERRVELCFEGDRSRTMLRRREFYNSARDGQDNLATRRGAIVPVQDIHDGKAQFIFVRTWYWGDDLVRKAAPTSINNNAYYASFNNYQKNGATPNPSQQ